MRLKIWWKVLTFREFVQLFIYRVGLKIIQLSRYRANCGVIVEEMTQVLKNGYKIKRKGNLIYVNSCESLDKSNYVLRLRTADIKVFEQVIVNKEYMPMLELIKRDAKENSIMNIVDAGSNIGLTLIFFKSLFPAAKIISIEPDYENNEQLKKNVEANGFEDSVQILHNALWKNDSDKLSISNDFRDGDSWSKSVKISNIQTFFSPKPITLDQVRKLFEQKTTIDIFKIDIEGAEAELFRNAEFVKTLQKTVRYLCIEIHDELDIRQEIYKVFAELNFTCLEEGETCFCINKNLL